MLKINEKNICQYLYYKIEKEYFESEEMPERSIELKEIYPLKKNGAFVYINLIDIYGKLNNKLSVIDNSIVIEIPDDEFDKYSVFKDIWIVLLIVDTQHLHLYLEKNKYKKYNATYKGKGFNNIQCSINEVIITRETYFNEIYAKRPNYCK